MKISSKILLILSAAMGAGFVVMCVIETLDRRGRDNVMQLFAGWFFYAVFFLLPAALLAFAALSPKARTALLLPGAAVCLIIAAAVKFVLAMPWFFALPSAVSAAMSAVLAIKRAARRKV